jgi:SAM-dependent methyltransferase
MDPAIESQRRYWDDAADTATFSLPLDADLLLKHVGRSARVLDLGCGYGRSLAELEARGFERLVGADPSPRMLERARGHAPAASLSLLAGLPLAEPDGAFDAVLLVAVLTCTPADNAQRALVREVLRLLSPGGIGYVADFLISDHEHGRARYARGVEEHAVHGVFSLGDGAVHRHHHPDWVAELLSPFERLHYGEFDAKTRRGNPACGFRFVGRKPVA